MAIRTVFVPVGKAPYVDVHRVEFKWNSGFALSQNQKNVKAIHESFNAILPDRKVLEISSKSMQDLGVELSAFNLKKYVPSLDECIPVECAFQGGKTFESGGPYTDLYRCSPGEAKRDPRLHESGALRAFFFEGKVMPLLPRTAFYNWLYINALLENEGYAEQLMQYDAFTDVVFNPEKSVNCQAEAAAQFVALYRLGYAEKSRDFESYLTLTGGETAG